MAAHGILLLLLFMLLLLLLLLLLQAALSTEMRGRIQEADLSVPVRWASVGGVVPQ